MSSPRPFYKNVILEIGISRLYYILEAVDDDYHHQVDDDDGENDDGDEKSFHCPDIEINTIFKNID